MIRFLLSFLFFLVSLTTLFQVPTILLWYVAIAATEYGHLLLFLPLGVVIWECCLASSVLTPYTIAAGVLSICLFLSPAYQAWALGRYLPLQLTEAYGPTSPTEKPFSFSHLWVHPKLTSIKREQFNYQTKDGSPLGLYFYPSALPGQRPCIVVVHGGGWNTGDYHQLESLNFALASAGYHVAAINYRLAPQSPWPAQKEDTLAALEFLRSKSEKLEIDTQHFVLLGRSAGGQIALATAYGTRDQGLCGVISLYAPTDMNFAYRYGKEDDILKSRSLVRQFLGGPPEGHQANYDDASPIDLVSVQSPPTLLLHGTRDELVWYLHGHRLQKAVLAAHRPFFLLDLPWATHAFDINVNGPAGQLTLYSIKWFLETTTHAPR